MGVVDFETNRLRQQEIEVKALVALVEHGNFHWAKKAERRLAEIAFPELLADYINETLDYDQLILEFWNESDPNSGWVHCSYSEGNNRKQYLKAYKDENNKTCYAPI